MENPFEPPKATIGNYTDADSFADAYRIVGKEIECSEDLSLPNICVRCGTNAEAGKRIDKTIYWCSPWVVALILLNLIIVLIAYFIVRKKTHVAYSLCHECASKRKQFVVLAVAGWLGTAIIGAAAATEESFMLFAVAVVTFIFAIIMTHKAGGPVAIRKHKNGVFTFKGFNEQFLARLR